MKFVNANNYSNVLNAYKHLVLKDITSIIKHAKQGDVCDVTTIAGNVCGRFVGDSNCIQTTDNTEPGIVLDVEHSSKGELVDKLGNTQVTWLLIPTSYINSIRCNNES